MAVEEVQVETKEETVPVWTKSVDTGLKDKIIRQVEYYFGDLNLSKDKFMQEEIQKESGCKSIYIFKHKYNNNYR